MKNKLAGLIAVLLILLTIFLILLPLELFGIFVLKLGGIQYESTGSFILFLAAYLIFSFFLDAFTAALPKVLCSLGMLKNPDGFFKVCLDTLLSFLLVLTLDAVMHSVSIPPLTAFCFAALYALLDKMFDIFSDRDTK